MPRIIVNWMSTFYDFMHGTFSREGPTFDLHKKAWNNYEKQLIISSFTKDDERVAQLFTNIYHAFPDHYIEFFHHEVHDILDFKEVKAIAEKALKPYEGYEIDLLISMGTTPMRTALILIHLEDNGYQTQLIQGIDKRQGGGESRFQKLSLDHSIFAGRLIAKQASLEETPSERWMPDMLKPIYREAEQVAIAEGVTTLIQGESGTGKELLANFIHEQSSRSSKNIVAVNCAALGDELLESRLFGYKKGAFTGAEEDRKGYFEAADRGILFLDEIGDISPYMQQTLLRVLQEGQFTPVGSTRPIKVDVRIVAATNRDLLKNCEEGTFRWDLYYRLSQAVLELPPFRAYPKSDKLAFFQYFLKMKTHVGKSKVPLMLLPEVRKRLLMYNFPGNIRELENIITNFYVFAEHQVKLADLERALRQYPHALSMDLDSVEKQHIQRVLRAYDYNLTQSATVLGIAVNTLKKRIQKYGISASETVLTVS
ncbi:MAG: sigma-54 dependent transcriptional regulator [Bacteroidota bacterium]